MPVVLLGLAKVKPYGVRRFPQCHLESDQAKKNTLATDMKVMVQPRESSPPSTWTTQDPCYGIWRLASLRWSWFRNTRLT